MSDAEDAEVCLYNPDLLGRPPRPLMRMDIAGTMNTPTQTSRHASDVFLHRLPVIGRCYRISRCLGTRTAMVLVSTGHRWLVGAWGVELGGWSLGMELGNSVGRYGFLTKQLSPN